ncbi:uncharacterized protein MONOS_3524 [Monocercomonoides exilis]|uniref:uncharacterized protein n=1 Tax=Monocercomonoides exilis TaxID=2049356 RepID=UPI00355A3DB8|nr:hypothetical protein MONOS_3524 [Monocercomonoides exilis]|eukprot:MONOS_3524.1-p1 / transcript=MONOS_3524.1 / gene=MONOS_3524 / organism=Monocercomonoides_exilis_PA203 / gene_product=unspecified product / transcript_product=unspecified product / location=Mono_scaffold00083:101188-102028(-) / protein_length=256 / sequence_SO=supercontig / SO=protein_coding / is_pseudo=false
MRHTIGYFGYTKSMDKLRKVLLGLLQRQSINKILSYPSFIYLLQIMLTEKIDYMSLKKMNLVNIFIRDYSKFEAEDAPGLLNLRRDYVINETKELIFEMKHLLFNPIDVVKSQELIKILAVFTKRPAYCASVLSLVYDVFEEIMKFCEPCHFELLIESGFLRMLLSGYSQFCVHSTQNDQNAEEIARALILKFDHHSLLKLGAGRCSNMKEEVVRIIEEECFEEAIVALNVDSPTLKDVINVRDIINSKHFAQIE